MAGPRNNNDQVPLAERYSRSALLDSERRRRQLERERLQRCESVNHEIAGVRSLDRPSLQKTNDSTEHSIGFTENSSATTLHRLELEAPHSLPDVRQRQAYPTPPPSASGLDSIENRNYHIIDLQAQVKRQESLIQGLRCSLDSEKKKSDQLLHDKNEIQEKYDQSFIDEDRQQCARLQRQLENAKNLVQSKNDEILGLQRRIAEHKEMEWDLKQQLDKAQRENRTLESRLAERESNQYSQQGPSQVAPAVSVELAISGDVNSLQRSSSRVTAGHEDDNRDSQELETLTDRSRTSNGRNHQDTHHSTVPSRRRTRGAYISMPRGERRLGMIVPLPHVVR